jgi:endonuclease/exonuclease/phosphatase family metal-dependent hydrolase
MSEMADHLPDFKIAPLHRRAIFFVAACLLITGCQRKSTAHWNRPAEVPAAHAKPVPAKILVAADLDAAADEAAEPTEKRPSARPTLSAAGSLRFISYNVENWLTMDRYIDGKNLKGAGKPEEQKAAVIAILSRQRPDVLGLCEIGQRADILDLQARLKAAGLDLPNLHYLGGVDPTRHLALLSRFPIKSTATLAKSDYTLEGHTLSIQRGVMDATLEVNGHDYRFLGVHLKSKREVENADQAEMRLNEAHLLRDHIDSIFASAPATNLVVYGDFNDTRASPAIKLIQGPYNHPNYLTPLPLKDRQGEYWTHFWDREDVYSRFDWIMVSQALKSEVNFQASRILDEPEWNKASDHRAVMMLLK